MSLGLHPDCRKRLTERLAAALSDISVKSEMFLDLDTVSQLFQLDAVLPSGKILERAQAYICETPTPDFVYKTISGMLSDTREYDGDAPRRRLVDLEGFTDVGRLAETIVEQYESLPWHYAVTLPLPESIGAVLARVIGDYPLGKFIGLAVPGEEFSEQFPLKSGIPLRDRSISREFSDENILVRLSRASDVPPTWNSKSICVAMFVDGFIGPFGRTTPCEDASDNVKAFLGLGLAVRLFKIAEVFGAAPAKGPMVVHRLVEGRWVVERTLELDQGIAQILGKLALEDLGGRIDSDKDRESFGRATLDLIRCAFSSLPRSGRLLLAGQWLFESHCGTDQLLSFVQAAVVMEILLGDKTTSDQIGLGELLGNRCAYLISSTQKERDQILADFKRIYDVRSRIVHDGKKRLDSCERQLFASLREMCDRVILKELQLFHTESRCE